MLSFGFLGTREPEDLLGFEFMCHMPCAARDGCFSIHVRHFLLIIKKHVGDLVANSTLKEFQQATSEAYSKKVRDTPLCVLSICCAPQLSIYLVQCIQYL
jgi:hypothetical protein